MKNDTILPLPDGWGMLVIRCLPPCTKRQQHEAAHGLLGDTLRSYADALEMEIPALHFDYGHAGKPFLPAHPEICFNLTHCDGLAACLVTDCECGVDAEPIRTLRPRVAERVCAPEEKQLLARSAHPDLLFTRLWTLKEAYVKAIGIGISYPMATVSFVPGNTQILSNRPEAAFAQFLLPGHVLSACLLQHREEHPVFRI